MHTEAMNRLSVDQLTARMLVRYTTNPDNHEPEMVTAVYGMNNKTITLYTGHIYNKVVLDWSLKDESGETWYLYPFK